MPLGTAPRRVAPNRWVTASGRPLTRAGSRYWESHYLAGTTDGLGHVGPFAHRNPLVDVRVPPPKRGVEIAQPGKPWQKLTPKEKMHVQATVPVPAHNVRVGADQVRHVPARRVAVPIGFGGASAIDRQRAAALAAQRAWLKAHPTKQQVAEDAKRMQAAAQGHISWEDPRVKAARDRLRLYKSQHPDGGSWMHHVPGIVGNVVKAAGSELASIPYNFVQGAGKGIVASSAPGHEKMGREAEKQLSDAARTVGAWTLGPHLTSAITHGDINELLSPGAGLDLALLLPGLKPLKGARAAVRGLRGARTSEEVASAAAKVAKEAGVIPEREARIEEWKRLGLNKKQVEAMAAVHDNQALLHPGGPEAFWRERLRLPTGQDVQEFVAAHPRNVLYQETPQAKRLRERYGGKGASIEPPAAAPSGGLLKRDLAPEQVAQNLRYVEGGDLHKPHLGHPEANGKVFRTLKNGTRVQVLGKITNQQRLKRLLALVPDAAERNTLARWYEQVEPTIQRFFGEDAPAILRGFAVSQANASPTGGITAVLRVFDKVKDGVPVTKDEISAVSESIQAAVKDEHVSSGMAAKLHDFTDAIEGKSTRTWMGDDPRGGWPVPNDVHMIRADGFVDPKIAERLQNPGPDSMLRNGIRNVVVDSGGSPGRHQYERMRERYEQFTDHLNEINFDGRSDWKPHEVQALEWAAIQRMHGVIPDNLEAAVANNMRRFNLEMTKGVGGIGEDLTLDEARQVAQAVQPSIEHMIEATDGLYPHGGIEIGVSAYEGAANASLHFDVIGSPEKTHALVTRLARTFDQYDVWATRTSQSSGAKPTLHINSPELDDPEKALALYRALYKADPKRFTGFMTETHEGVPGISIVMRGGTVTQANLREFEAKFQQVVDDAIESVGGNHSTYNHWADNTHVIDKEWKGGKGKVDIQGAKTGRSKRALDDPHSAEARSRLEAAVEEVRSRRQEGLAPSERALYQRPAQPASALPKGATEFLKGGGTRVHYFEGADVSTIMHELFHVSLHDLKGRHLLTLADEYAAGKPLAEWTDAEHEAVADAFEQWLRTGETTNPKLRSAFVTIQEFMLKLIGKAKGAGMRVPKDVEDAFNYMFREPPEKRLQDEVVKAAKRAKEEVYPAQEARRSVERTERFSAMEAARVEAGGGIAGQKAALEQLSGEYWKEPFDDLTHLEEPDMEYLIDEVGTAKRLSGIQKTSLIEALRKANRGEVFTPSDAALVFKAFGPAKATRAAGLTRTQRALDLLTQIVNIPRSFMSSFDVSGILRQGLMTAVMHPVMTAKLTPSMMRYLFSEKYYLERMARYRQDPRYHVLTTDGGLELTDTGHEFGSEEAYQSHIAELMTGGKYGPIRASGRAYTGLLNDLRWGSATNMFDLALESGMLTPEELKRIGKVSNWATGRGHLGKHDQSAQLLNLFLFSPRLLKSRFDTLNPWFYKGLDPEGRLFLVPWSQRTPAQKQALKATSRLLLAGGSVLGLAKLAGADIELNPRSSDFGKIKVGNTRVDFWGGHQAIVRTFFQALTGQRKITSTGEIRDVNNLDPIFRFFEGKASPPMSLAFDIHRGKTFTGEPFYWGPPWDPKSASGSRLWPLGLQDTWEAYQQADDASLAALTYALAFVGLSTQTYEPSEPKGGGGGGDPLANLGGDSRDPLANLGGGGGDPLAGLP